MIIIAYDIGELNGKRQEKQTLFSLISAAIKDKKTLLGIFSLILRLGKHGKELEDPPQRAQGPACRRQDYRN